MYTKKLFYYFQHPVNMGEIKNPDTMAQVGNPVCGDVMKMYLKIGNKAKGKGKSDRYIKDVKFQTLGCAAAIATSSIATKLVKGKTLDKAKKLTNQDIARELGGLPPNKLHCSVLAVQALHQAIKSYEEKQSPKA